MRALFTALTVTAAALLAGCASTSDAESTIQPGDRIEVEYRDGGAVLALRNESFQSPDEVYSKGDSAYLKVATDENINKLILGWTELSFFEVASPTPYPQAKATLSIKMNGETYVRSRLPLEMSSIEDLTQFNNCLTVFRAIYDNTRSYHSAAAISGEELQRQNEKIQENAKEALSRPRGGQ